MEKVAPNLKRGELNLQLGKQSWRAKVTLDVIMRVETALDKGIVEVITLLSEGKMTTTQLCEVLLPVVRAGGNDIKMPDIRKAVWDAGLAPTMSAVGEILSTALSSGDDEVGNDEAVEAD